MKKLGERTPGDFVRAPLSDERLHELWAAVERGESRLKALRRRRRAAAVASATALAVGLGLWLGRPADEPGLAAAPDGSKVSAEARELTLGDGSVLSLLGAARVHVVVMSSDEVRVRLAKGAVECEVAHDPGRRFVLEAAGVEVVVTGTRFAVTAGEGSVPSGVVVRVDRGSVEVRLPSGQRLASLGAGQLWASEGMPLASSPSAPVAATPASDGRDAGAARTGQTSSSALSPAERSPPDPSPARPTTRSPARATSPAPVPPAGPRELLSRASEARLAGRAREASVAFEEMMRRHPGDERAGYAAFMLGRLRLDELADAAGALEAFSFAVEHPGSGFFPEDAEARRIEALAKLGRAAECRSASDRFAAEHPRSTRAAALAALCRPRR